MHRPKLSQGFSLIELAIVLVIVALLVGGLIVALSTQRDSTNEVTTQKQLATIQEALLGFAAINGRLPCPATSTSGGREAFCTASTGACTQTTTEQSHGRCAANHDGFLPAASLGLAPIDDQGFAIDAWANRIRYAVTQAAAGTIEYPFTAAASATTGIKGAWSADPTTLSLAPDLRICTTSAGIASGSCGAGTSVADNAVAVVLSTGKNGGTTPGDNDELANWTSSTDRAFVSHLPTDTFDDIVTWISPNLLYSRLIAAGRIP